MVWGFDKMVLFYLVRLGFDVEFDFGFFFDFVEFGFSRNFVKLV